MYEIHIVKSGGVHLIEKASQVWQLREWPDDPGDVFIEQGFALEERSLSVGWARVLARIDMRARKVYIDNAAIESYARELERSPEEVRRQALAHEVGHLYMPSEKGAEAELAAQTFASFWK